MGVCIKALLGTSLVPVDGKGGNRYAFPVKVILVGSSILNRIGLRTVMACHGTAAAPYYILLQSHILCALHP